MLNKVYTKS